MQLNKLKEVGIDCKRIGEVSVSNKNEQGYSDLPVETFFACVYLIAFVVCSCTDLFRHGG